MPHSSPRLTPTDDDLFNRWAVLLGLLVTLYVLDRLGVFRALSIAPARALARHATARTTFDTWVVVGDRDEIESRIRELEFGEITFLDQDGNEN